MSPLSSSRLVKSAFFSSDFPIERVDAFRKFMPTYESFMWPGGLMFRIVKVQNVLRQISGWNSNSSRVFILAASDDKLMSSDLMERAAAEYRARFSKLMKEEEFQAADEIAQKDTGGNERHGVRYGVVKGASHHLQNDSQWEDAARQVLEFYEQL